MGEKKNKHLHELLQEDQEPFHLNLYITDFRSQMGFSDMRAKNAAVSSPGLFSCEGSCFFAARSKSPLLELPSLANKKTSDGRVFLKIPARTAAILLEAAARIQKQQWKKAKNTKTYNKARSRNRRNGFGMFGSVLKRLTNRKSKPRFRNAEGNAIFSEPTSSSSGRERSGEIGDKCFFESPFRFVLQTTSSSSDNWTPHFTSRATSPARHSAEDEDRDETKSLEKEREEEEEEEDKEQCSPVSVLDPLEEEEEHGEDHHQVEPEHLNLLSCSFGVVQRAKRRLLRKLHKFEKLAGLDPVDLEGMTSQEQEEEEGEEEEYEESEEDDNIRVYDSYEEYEDVDEAMARKSKCAQEERTKKIEEKQRKGSMMNAWSVRWGVEDNVEAVVWNDMREETGEWRHRGEVEEAASNLELSIFFFLIDEFSHELASCP